MLRSLAGAGIGLLGLGAAGALQAQDAASGIDVHGAVRLEYALRTWDEVQRDRGGNFDLELFRIDFDGELGDILLSAQHRWYVNQGFDTVHHAWVGYDFDDWRMKLGVAQAPFGLLPYASHSWWFGLGYYVGLEDDYDAGVVFERRAEGPHRLHFAFFKQQELSAGDPARYSFDLMRGDAGFGDATQQNEEQNQLNARYAYVIEGGDSTAEIGVSGMAGQIYNHETMRMGERWAAAVHTNWNYGPWNVQAQVASYEMNPENPAAVSDDSVQGAFFNFANMIPAAGSIYTLNVAYEYPLRAGPFESVLFYNDHSRLRKDVDSWNESWLNTTGALLTAGPVFTYIDFVHGRNATFVGPYDGAAINDSTRMLEGNGDRELRFNVNVGYYF